MEQGYTLRKFLKSPLPLAYLPYVFLILSFLGFLDATYLTIQHYSGVIPPCTIHGCDLVLTSKYSALLGIPVSLIGALYYLLNIVLGGLFIQTKQKMLITIIFTLNVFSLIVAAGLIYLQAFVIQAFCQYCLFSELMNFLMFDTSWWLYNSLKEEN